MSQRIKHVVIGIVTLFLSQHVCAQENKDNSKPTNLYSQVDNFFEYVHGPDYRIYGYNPRLSLVPSEDISFVIDLPLRLNDQSRVFGPGDIRVRTFYVPYKNYDKLLGSFGASVDIYAPTGKYENGLGTSSWRISPGVIVGLILNKAQTISVFPNLSYTYTSLPSSDAVPQELKEIDHGLTFQVTNSFVLSDDAFLLVTPIFDIKDIDDSREDEFIIELEPVFDLRQDKYQAGLFYRGAFMSNTHTFSLYFTLFL